MLQAKIRKIKFELFSNLKISYELLEKNKEGRLKIEVSQTTVFSKLTTTEAKQN